MSFSNDVFVFANIFLICIEKKIKDKQKQRVIQCEKFRIDSPLVFDRKYFELSTQTQVVKKVQHKQAYKVDNTTEEQLKKSRILQD